MNSPLTRNQIIRLLSQHPLNPKILFKEKPSPVHPTLMFDLREKPDGGAEAIFYPSFFHMPPEDQRNFLNKALEHLDELYQLYCTNPSKAMMLMGKNLHLIKMRDNLANDVFRVSHELSQMKEELHAKIRDLQMQIRTCYDENKRLREALDLLRNSVNEFKTLSYEKGLASALMQSGLSDALAQANTALEAGASDCNRDLKLVGLPEHPGQKG